MFNLDRKVSWACPDIAYNKIFMIGIKYSQTDALKVSVFWGHAIYKFFSIQNVHFVS